MTINMEMAFTTPPIGLNIYILQGACKPWGVTYEDIVKGALPYLIADAIVLLLVMVFPQLALWLPSHVKF